MKPVPPALASRSPLGWLLLCGPGAVIASMNIGTGELVFSSRGGALFGYQILFLFVLISLLKWGLVFASARHLVITGVHPYSRMKELPGPRGWFLLVLFLIACVVQPAWLSFLSGVLGNLISWVTGTMHMFNGAIDFIWAGIFLAVAILLTSLGGYTMLERIQIGIIFAMIASAIVTLFLYDPDWLEMIKGALIPQTLEYPEWLRTHQEYDKIAARPVWVETSTYVGVIGGSGFDYLAYTSWIRNKQWGRAGLSPATAKDFQEMAADPSHPARLWVRAPLIDLAVSFILIIVFSAVFVASGVIFLGPNEKVPDAANLLNLQSEFVTNLHPWLMPLYMIGAFLTMFGTVYGVLEIALTIARELARTVDARMAERHDKRIKKLTVLWCSIVAYILLAWMFFYQRMGGEPTILMTMITPANLFTGVFFCGLLCFLFPWMDRKFIPRPLRMSRWLLSLNLVSGVIFLVIGLKAYWDDKSRWFAICGMTVVIVVGLVGAWILGRVARERGVARP